MRMWAAGLSARGERLSFLLLLAVLLLVFLAAWLPGPVPVLGNLHDLFIPFNAAEAVRQGLTLHQELHSPFGWVYFHLNHLAEQLQLRFAPEASTPGSLLMSGVVFFVPVVAIWFGFRYALRGAVPTWLLPFALALMTAPRAADDFTHKNLLWYGLYNNHNWGVLLIQIGAFAALIRRGGRVKGTLFASTSALCLYLVAHYKVSFLFASSFVFLASLALLRPSKTVAVAIKTAIVLGGAVLVTWVAGYDYAGYVADLLETIRAREGSSRSKGVVILTAVLAFFVAITSGAGAARRPGRSRVSIATALVIVGVLVATLGDWSRYWGYLAMTAGIIALGDDDRREPVTTFKALAVLFLITNLVLNVLSLTRVVQLKLVGNDKRDFVARTIEQGDGRELSVLVPAPEHALPEDLPRAFGRQPAQAWARLAVASGEDRRAMPKYSNAAYMDAHAEARAWLEGLPSGTRAGEVEFANALPVLTGLPLPPGHHWLHIEATVSRGGLQQALAPLAQWDVILLPVASVDGLNQVYLNCAAASVLAELPDVGLVRVTPHYIYLVRGTVSGIVSDREAWRDLASEIIAPGCNRLTERRT